ncbi:LPXTG cell wall anchor domain-containing protein [Brevibacterium luteolum]|uniref:LPXTG cell wall anchor domain-containing protein n=1 Tax=Brevibacterium luteolum TaxID=199591 RepID=UPI001C22C3FF|nr:LPXTG cell wall anchor domain-containing protein [Brevibacterium luteolum]MBU8579132.1 PT domain-containing protein [Brevibacterium luteolum]
MTVIGLPMASSAAAKIQVSVDEQNYSDRMPRGLFDSIDRIVPGDTIHDGLWLKNTTTDAINVTVQLRWSGPENPTALDDVLTVGLNGDTTTAGQLRAQPLTVDLGQLNGQATTKVDATAALPLSADNSTQREYLQLELVLQLSGEDAPSPTPTDDPGDDPTAGSTPGPTSEPTGQPTGEPTDGPTSQPEPTATQPPHDDDNSPLPRTGAEIAILAVVGLIIIAGGITAILATRRKRPTRENTPDA